MIALSVLMGICGLVALWNYFEWLEEHRARRHFDHSDKKSVVFLIWNKRRVRWQRFVAFPDFLEFLALGLSSGLNVDQAWERGVRYLPKGPLREELRQTANDFSLGRPRQEALFDLCERLEDERMSATVGLITHALKYGTAVEKLLFEQAKRHRAEVLLAMEKRAQTASLRLLFPLVFFILPTIFIVLFGPLVLGFLENGRIF
jgi:tight adherence protein C